VKILKGAKPGDLAVEFPNKLKLIINLKTSKGTWGVDLSPILLARTDEVIEWRCRLLRRMSPLLAPLRHADRLCECPFIGEDRKSLVELQNGANDPKPASVRAGVANPWVRPSGAALMMVACCEVSTTPQIP
jgi:hypothetical protein